MNLVAMQEERGLGAERKGVVVRDQSGVRQDEFGCGARRGVWGQSEKGWRYKIKVVSVQDEGRGNAR